MLRHKAKTIESTPAQALFQLHQAIEQSDAVLIGAGAGLSASAGFSYKGERFERYFKDFASKYGFHDMYVGGFFPYPTAEEYWAYWSRYIMVNRYMDAPKPVYQALLSLVQKKDSFVLTTNVDHCFQKAGFDKSRLFYTQGDYGLFQCSAPCCQKTWDNEEVIRRMAEEQKDMRVPTSLIPLCPRCGKPMTMNLRSDDTFVQDDGWYQAAGQYKRFLLQHQKGRILYLELGVGYNTPGIIKYPFWKMALQNPEAVYACVNRGQAFVPGEFRQNALCLDDDIGSVLNNLLRMRGI